MQKQGPPLPLPSLRLWVSPLQLVSAAIWQTVQQRVVRDYGMLDEFVTMVTNLVPEVFDQRLRTQLSLGLQAQLVLELCRTSQPADLKTIQSHLERMRTLRPLLRTETTDAEVELPESNFPSLVQTLLNDPEERHNFFQEVFPVKFGPKYDATITALTRMFLRRLEQLLPVPTLQQAASLLSDGPFVLEEYVESMSYSQDLKTLLEHHSDLCQLHNDDEYSLSAGDCILTALEGCPTVGMAAGNEQTEIHPALLGLVDSLSSDHVESVVPTKTEETLMDSELEEGMDSDFEEDMGVFCETVVVIEEGGRVEPMTGVADSSGKKGESSIYINGETKLHRCIHCKKIFWNAKHEQICLMCHQRLQAVGGAVPASTYPQPSSSTPQSSALNGQQNPSPEENNSDTKMTGQQDKFPNSFAEWSKQRKAAQRKKGGGSTDNKTHLSSPEEKVPPNTFAESLKPSHEHKPAQRKKQVDAYKCDECGETFNSRRVLDIHEHLHRTNFCTECQRSFPTPFQLKQHMANHRTGSSLLCWDCGKSYKSTQRLEKHRMYAHATATSKRFPCDQCDKVYGIKSFLRLHKQKEHQGVRYPCTYCGKLFLQADSLTRHNLTHTQEKPYPCTTCDKAFRSASELKKHMRYHTGERPFKCDVCGKGFVQSPFLTAHKLSHTGERPYKCPFCPKAYNRNATLVIHKRTHTGERPYVCSDCGKSFHGLFLLKQHQRNKKKCV